MDSTFSSKLKQRIITPPQPDSISERIFKSFSAQIGELGWHSVHADPRIDDISQAHAAVMTSLIRDNQLTQPGRPLRILEIGAYAHHSVHIAAAAVGGIGVAHDISPVSLRVGDGRARDLGLAASERVLVAGDFHDLPFSDGYFDLVFVASSIHHTWRPWVVLKEVLRVLRPGGVLHLFNEPVGRACCMYKFRCNRFHMLTPFEAEIRALGLMTTVSSPVPETRAETLFGMIENDRIPLHIYKETLSAEADILDWSLNFSTYIEAFETWVLELPAGSDVAQAIVERLSADLALAAPLQTPRDQLSGIAMPTADDLWPMAYRVAALLRRLSNGEDRDDILAQLFGAALRCTVVKRGGVASDDMFRRTLPDTGGVRLDQPTVQGIDVTFENRIPTFDHKPDLFQIFPSGDWMVVEDGIRCLANTKAVCEVLAPDFDLAGVWILRVYSVLIAKPYFFSVLVDGKLVYSHAVAVSESHLARFVVEKGQSVQIVHHDEEGQPTAESLTSRIIPTFVELRRSAAN